MGNETKTEDKKPLTPREAVKAAAEYYLNAVGATLEQANLLLEELELSKDKKCWLVTLSHRDPTSTVFTLYPGAADPKQYKLFRVDVETGDVLSMKATKI